MTGFTHDGTKLPVTTNTPVASAEAMREAAHDVLLDALANSRAWMDKHDKLLAFIQARPAVLQEWIAALPSPPTGTVDLTFVPIVGRGVDAIDRRDPEAMEKVRTQIAAMPRFSSTGKPTGTVDEARVSLEVAQHFGWLKMYLDGMTPENWRDMKDRIENQMRSLIASMPSAKGDGAARRWRHKKRGTTYTEIARASLQDNDPSGLTTGDVMVVYRSDDTGKVYCRGDDEFEDGRFEPLQTGARR